MPKPTDPPPTDDLTPEQYDDLHALVDALPPLDDDQCRGIGELLVQVRRTSGGRP